MPDVSIKECLCILYPTSFNSLVNTVLPILKDKTKIQFRKISQVTELVKTSVSNKKAGPSFGPAFPTSSLQIKSCMNAGWI
jgi:hypothetical protein